MIFLFTLKEKIQITHDVFLLKLTSNIPTQIPQYGQFMTFIMKAGGRAYSIANGDGINYEFIIKRLENGKGGSKEACDTPIGGQIKVVGPAGRFLLKENTAKRLFLGTGTGFAPLYFQILGTYNLNLGGTNTFIFGVRESKDIFFVDEMEKLKKEKGNFDYKIYVSREQSENHNFGRITEYITPENVASFEEFYICGNPAMVSEAKQKLLALGVEKEYIHSEEY